MDNQRIRDVSSNTNVIVEYTDPSSVFPEVEPVLKSLLPLRNLHWKSTNRPLRSIDSVYIDFVPSSSNNHNNNNNNNNNNKDNNNESRSHEGYDADLSQQNRRHQIPGLRETPYVKLYLLHCQDNDEYKTTWRNWVRDWIKSTAPSTSTGSSGKGNHNACEYIIVHVVEEGSPVAFPPSAISKWPGRGPKSLLDKIKSDFNGSGKNAVDRVAQLEFPKKNATFRSPNMAGQTGDLIAKLKSAILSSFTQRIARYEEDIRQKDSQRNLPGWNFCTFFVLKEGLILGFEHVGLYEDALTGYDELAAGLDLFVQDKIIPGDYHGGTFLESTPDIVARAKSALEANAKGQHYEDSPEKPPDPSPDPCPSCLNLPPELFPFDATRKSYRQMIVANKISLFELRVYIFARQMKLLLLLATRPPSLKPRASSTAEPYQDLTSLSEVCQRATESITLASQVLRHELWKGLRPSVSEGSYSEGDVEVVIKSIIASWVYSAISEVLIGTETSVLDVSNKALSAVDDKALAETIAVLLSGSTATSEGRISNTLKERRSSSPPLPATSITGGASLAAGRGDLFSFARRILESLAKPQLNGREWEDVNLLYHPRGLSEDMEDVTLSDDHDDDKSATIKKKQKKKSQTQERENIVSLAVDNPVARHALLFSGVFRGIYEQISEQMFRHHVVAGQTRSAHLALGDLAFSKYQTGDYDTTARCFAYLARFYGKQKWVELEGIFLELGAQCLNRSNNHAEYVDALLELLPKYTRTRKDGGRREGLSTRDTAARYFDDLIRFSHKRAEPHVAPLFDFFGDLVVDPTVVHSSNDEDGFLLHVHIRSLLGKVPFQRFRLRLVDSSRKTNHEISCECTGEFEASPAPKRFTLASTVSASGRYIVTRAEIHAANLVFTKDFDTLARQIGPFDSRGIPYYDTHDGDNGIVVSCYPYHNGLQAKVISARETYLADSRSLDVDITTGCNSIQRGKLHVKPMTAGLGIRHTDASVAKGDIEIEKSLHDAVVKFSKLARDSFAKINIPYTIDRSADKVSVRLDMEYEADGKTFSLTRLQTITAALPISVNVQDTFRRDLLLSTYTIFPGTTTPVRLLNCHLSSSKTHRVESSAVPGQTHIIFPKEPASIVFKTVPRESQPSPNGESASTLLEFRAEFALLDEECLYIIQQQFLSDLRASAFHQYARLLLPCLLRVLSSAWTAGDIEVIGLLGQVELGPFEDFQWDTVLRPLEEETRYKLADWLRRWHLEHTRFVLPEIPPPSVARRLAIPVGIPEFQVVHTACLQPLDVPASSPDSSSSAPRAGHGRGFPPVTAGSVMATQLTISHTRRWCPPAIRIPSSALEFTYDVLASPDTWMVGGRRRGNFRAEEGEVRNFPVLLIPQRPGHLLLPDIAITSFSVTTSANTGKPEQQPQQQQQQQQQGDAVPLQYTQVASEVDFQNRAEAVYVTQNHRQTTVRLEPLAFNDGAPRPTSLIDAVTR